MTMRAVILPAIHKNTTLSEKASPLIQSNHALVKMHAAGWNRRDLWITKGMYPGIRTPITLGSDGCGTVIECPDSPEWVGREVVLCPSLNWGEKSEHQAAEYSILGMPQDGTCAEMLSIPIANLFEKPNHLSHDEAASIPLAGLTAWRSVYTKARIKAGDNVLITGIGGGTAIFALQFALALGANVFVTSSSPEKVDRAKAMGAKGGALYTEDDWGARLQKKCPNGFDAIIDSAGGEGFGMLVRLAGMGGRIVFFGGTRGQWPNILPQHLFYKQVSILSTTMGSPIEFGEMLQFIAEHQIHPILDKVYAFEDHQESIERLKQADRFGKVIVHIQD